MSDASSGTARLVGALDVRTYGRIGLAVGGVAGVAAYLLFVVGSDSPGTYLLYLPLSVVLALATGAVVTAVLVGAEAYKLVDEGE